MICLRIYLSKYDVYEMVELDGVGVGVARRDAEADWGARKRNGEMGDEEREGEGEKKGRKGRREESGKEERRN